MSRGQANLLRAFAIWTIYVWVTRMWTIWRDNQSVGFKAVHTVLAVVSVGFAIAGLIVVSRVRRRQLSGAGAVQEPAGASR